MPQFTAESPSDQLPPFNPGDSLRDFNLIRLNQDEIARRRVKLMAEAETLKARWNAIQKELGQYQRILEAMEG